jgi:hypothetical protein
VGHRALSQHDGADRDIHFAVCLDGQTARRKGSGMKRPLRIVVIILIALNLWLPALIDNYDGLKIAIPMPWGDVPREIQYALVDAYNLTVGGGYNDALKVEQGR